MAASAVILESRGRDKDYWLGLTDQGNEGNFYWYRSQEVGTWYNRTWTRMFIRSGFDKPCFFSLWDLQPGARISRTEAHAITA